MFQLRSLASLRRKSLDPTATATWTLPSKPNPQSTLRPRLRPIPHNASSKCCGHLAKMSKTVPSYRMALEWRQKTIQEEKMKWWRNIRSIGFYWILYRFMWYWSITSLAFSLRSLCCSRNLLSLSAMSFLHSPHSISPALHRRSRSASLLLSSSKRKK